MALEDYRSNMMKCSRCPYCKFIPLDHIKSWRFQYGCPSIAYKNFQSYCAGGRLAAALALLEGKIDYSDTLIDIVYHCLACGSCDISDKICRYQVNPLEVFLELRAKLVEDGQILTEHMLLIDNLRREDTTILGKVKAERGKWAEGLDVKDLTKERAEVVFHAGCNFSYDTELWKVTRTAITMLKNAGVDVGIMGRGEACCGSRAYSMGYRGEFTKYAENNIAAWTGAGVKTVITSCSDCYWALKRLYPQVGSKFEVLHTVEFIDRLIKEGKLEFTKEVPMKVTYQDPCHLGRHGEPYVPWNGVEKKIFNQIIVHDPPKPRYSGAFGVYDPPRDVLRSIPGLELAEMERIREYAWCCGAGGGVREGYPGFSSWTASERIEEAKASGAEAIVSACPWCERNFVDAISGSGQRMKVYDVIELVQQAL